MIQNQRKDDISISPITAFSDNYIWCISSSKTQKAVLVDPGDANVCIQFLIDNHLVLTSILITHHHADHVGGINQLRQYCNERAWPLTVYGPATEAKTFHDVSLIENDNVELAELGITLNVIDIPGHTLGHIAYLYDYNLFCGDTLFSGGCGRIFEGTPQQMFESLQKLSALPSQTRVFCAHEYTLANLEFALSVEPENIELIQYYNHAKQLRKQNITTIPSSILLEKKVNPFLRCDHKTVQNAASSYGHNAVNSTLDTFTIIRQWKNEY